MQEVLRVRLVAFGAFGTLKKPTKYIQKLFSFRTDKKTKSYGS